MFKMANLILLAVAVSLIFVSGCKDKPAPDVDPVKDAPVDSPPNEGADPVAPVAGKEVKPEEASHDVWMTDYKAAMKKAAAEKKDMLIDFSGSDWCVWCIRLDKEVFSQKEFIEEASKNFVFVVLDFPRDTSKMTRQLQEQNEELQKKFQVEDFPTVFLTDAKGMPYARTGYRAGGPKVYLEYISTFRNDQVKVTELMTKADSPELDDGEKAKLLDEAISLMSPVIVDQFDPGRIDKIIEKILALDSENKAGLRDNYFAKRALKDVATQIRERNADKGFELVNKIIKDMKISGSTEQNVYYYKAMVHDLMEDGAGTLENLEKAIAADPESIMAENLRVILKTYFSKPVPVPASEPTFVPTPPEKATE
ncbi:MAG: thioredoxin fold domain-containing protein [Planctomycetes bacterium]|nr:thioredoxin fold domain-containing protein [Planctomycetota bacterium]